MPTNKISFSVINPEVPDLKKGNFVNAASAARTYVGIVTQYDKGKDGSLDRYHVTWLEDGHHSTYYRHELTLVAKNLVLSITSG